MVGPGKTGIAALLLRDLGANRASIRNNARRSPDRRKCHDGYSRDEEPPYARPAAARGPHQAFDRQPASHASGNTLNAVSKRSISLIDRPFSIDRETPSCGAAPSDCTMVLIHWHTGPPAKTTAGDTQECRRLNATIDECITDSLGPPTQRSRATPSCNRCFPTVVAQSACLVMISLHARDGRCSLTTCYHAREFRSHIRREGFCERESMKPLRKQTRLQQPCIL